MNGGQCGSGRNCPFLPPSQLPCPLLRNLLLPPLLPSSSSVTQSIYPLIFFCIDLHQSSFFFLSSSFSLTHSIITHLTPLSSSSILSLQLAFYPFVFAFLSLFAVASHQSLYEFPSKIIRIVYTFLATCGLHKLRSTGNEM